MDGNPLGARCLRNPRRRAGAPIKIINSKSQIPGQSDLTPEVFIMINQSYTYPSLTKSYKGFYPFKIGTTSFIYPDLYVPNVRMLGPFVDEIELLLFESVPSASLLSKTVIADLGHLSRDFNLTYNIHLPTDIAISDPNPDRRRRAVAKLLNIIERVERLSPATCTLHVPFAVDAFGDESVRKWQDIVYRNLAKMVKSGVPAGRIAVESLNYPFAFIENIIKDLNLFICMDIGHLIMLSEDLQAFFNMFAGLVAIIHLHGVQHGKDHLPLDRLPKSQHQPVFEILKKFNETVSLEVFNFEHLQTSLNFLERCWNNDPTQD
jgi:sugar phosphate isomerase/epimerase